MEYVFSYDNRKIIIYAQGNFVYYNVIFVNGMVQKKIVAKDYHQGLGCIEHQGEIYCSYITVAREVVWQNVVTDNRLILFADRNELWDMENLKIVNIEGSPVIFFQAKNPVTEDEEVRYIYPEGDKKIKILLCEKSNITTYDFYEVYEGLLLSYITKEKNGTRYFMMKKEGKDDICIKEHIFLERESFINLKEEYTKKAEKCRIEVEDVKREYESRLKSDLNYVEKEYRRQYEELESLTKDIQEEGKKWRELYYKAVKKR